MKKGSLIFYWAILILLTFLYYETGDTFYSTIPINVNGGMPLVVIIQFIVPLMLVLSFVRLRLLKPIIQRQRFFDVAYFVIPILIIFTCLAAQIWAGIILSALAGVLIVYEFFRGITKKDSLSFKDR
ncbi:MAG TPA: hypothetical protein VK517_00135 [Cyclobacteriaceae bacterium]|nr:hypothetical protein [Cyclobacteriaceae bacterium]